MRDSRNGSQVEIVKRWAHPRPLPSVRTRGRGTGLAEQDIDVGNGEVGTGKAQLFDVFRQRHELRDVAWVDLGAIKVQRAQAGW